MKVNCNQLRIHVFVIEHLSLISSKFRGYSSCTLITYHTVAIDKLFPSCIDKIGRDSQRIRQFPEICGHYAFGKKLKVVYDLERPPNQAHICNFPNLHVTSANLELFGST